MFLVGLMLQCTVQEH